MAGSAAQRAPGAPVNTATLSPPTRTWGGYRHADLRATAISLLLVLAWDASGLDHAAAQAVAGAAGFAWRDHVLTRHLLHDGGRLLAALVLALLALNVWRPVFAPVPRTERAAWLGVTVLCVLAVPALKQLSLTSCPWDLAEFGGVARYVSHWQLGIGDGGPGRCFPSGHATAAFAFFGGWFVLRDTHPRRARRWLAAVLAAGALFGTGQFLRGAHFPSHTLWSAWLCWALTLALLGRRNARTGLAD